MKVKLVEFSDNIESKEFELVEVHDYLRKIVLPKIEALMVASANKQKYSENTDKPVSYKDFKFSFKCESTLDVVNTQDVKNEGRYDQLTFLSENELESLKVENRHLENELEFEKTQKQNTKVKAVNVKTGGGSIG